MPCGALSGGSGTALLSTGPCSYGHKHAGATQAAKGPATALWHSLEIRIARSGRENTEPRHQGKVQHAGIARQGHPVQEEDLVFGPRKHVSMFSAKKLGRIGADFCYDHTLGALSSPHASHRKGFEDQKPDVLPRSHHPKVPVVHTTRRQDHEHHIPKQVVVPKQLHSLKLPKSISLPRRSFKMPSSYRKRSSFIDVL